jgi:hypothetical protein
MGPDKNSSIPPQNQGSGEIAGTKGRPRRAHRPRSRLCLLKGCGRVFLPKQAMARYCSDACREKARRWMQWKAQQHYRHSPNGRQKRQTQSRRYRERRKERRENAALTAARVIPNKFFFVLLRPPGLLSRV